MCDLTFIMQVNVSTFSTCFTGYKFVICILIWLVPYTSNIWYWIEPKFNNQINHSYFHAVSCLWHTKKIFEAVQRCMALKLNILVFYKNYTGFLLYHSCTNSTTRKNQQICHSPLHTDMQFKNNFSFRMFFTFFFFLTFLLRCGGVSNILWRTISNSISKELNYCFV